MRIITILIYTSLLSLIYGCFGDLPDPDFFNEPDGGSPTRNPTPRSPNSLPPVSPTGDTSPRYTPPDRSGGRNGGQEPVNPGNFSDKVRYASQKDTKKIIGTVIADSSNKISSYVDHEKNTVAHLLVKHDNIDTKLLQDALTKDKTLLTSKNNKNKTPLQSLQDLYQEDKKFSFTNLEPFFTNRALDKEHDANLKFKGEIGNETDNLAELLVRYINPPQGLKQSLDFILQARPDYITPKFLTRLKKTTHANLILSKEAYTAIGEAYNTGNPETKNSVVNFFTAMRKKLRLELKSSKINFAAILADDIKEEAVKNKFLQAQHINSEEDMKLNIFADLLALSSQERVDYWRDVVQETNSIVARKQKGEVKKWLDHDWDKDSINKCLSNLIEINIAMKTNPVFFKSKTNPPLVKGIFSYVNKIIGNKTPYFRLENNNLILPSAVGDRSGTKLLNLDDQTKAVVFKKFIEKWPNEEIFWPTKAIALYLSGKSEKIKELKKDVAYTAQFLTPFQMLVSQTISKKLKHNLEKKSKDYLAEDPSLLLVKEILAKTDLVTKLKLNDPANFPIPYVGSLEMLKLVLPHVNSAKQECKIKGFSTMHCLVLFRKNPGYYFGQDLPRIIKYLNTQKVSLDDESNDGTAVTPLMLAAQYTSIDTFNKYVEISKYDSVKTLLSKKNALGQNIFVYALKSRLSSKLARRLFEKIDTDLAKQTWRDAPSDNKKYGPLRFIIRGSNTLTNSNYLLILNLLEKGAAIYGPEAMVMGPDNTSYSPLAYAMDINNWDLFEAIIDEAKKRKVIKKLLEEALPQVVKKAATGISLIEKVLSKAMGENKDAQEIVKNLIIELRRNEIDLNWSPAGLTQKLLDMLEKIKAGADKVLKTK